jgi:nicotinate phosphoribosyltransferase
MQAKQVVASLVYPDLHNAELQDSYGVKDPEDLLFAMLDEAGMDWCRIVVSNSLDEQIIQELTRAGACVDSFGVGERLITAKSDPVFGGVYKLVAVEADGLIIPKIKVSENVAKITTPHFKKVYRLYEPTTGKAIADYICVHDETLDPAQPLELFDPSYIWKRKTVQHYHARELLVPIFKDGRLVYDSPGIESSRAYCQREIESLWDEVKRFENPHTYYVDLSQKLWDIKNGLIEKNGRPGDQL